MKKIALFNILVFFSLSFPFFLVSAGDPSAQLETIFTNIGNWLFSFLIAGAVLGVIIGAFMILLSGGDPGKANTGKMIIIYALIAVIIGALAKGLVTTIRGLI